MADDGLYAFGKSDAGELIRLIGGNGGEFQEEPPLYQEAAAGPRLVRFEMTGDWSSGETDADFWEMDGTSIGSDTLRDPEGIFAELGEGDRGLAMFQGGQYWAIQALCPAPPEEEESP